MRAFWTSSEGRGQSCQLSCSNLIWCEFLYNYHLQSQSWASCWKPPSLGGSTNPLSSLLLLLFLFSVSDFFCWHLEGCPCSWPWFSISSPCGPQGFLEVFGVVEQVRGEELGNRAPMFPPPLCYHDPTPKLGFLTIFASRISWIHPFCSHSRPLCICPF